MNVQLDGLMVLEQLDIGEVVSIPGRHGPSFLLTERYVDHLADLLLVARSEPTASGQPRTSEQVAPLLAEVETLVTGFRFARNKFYAGPPPEVELKSTQREFDRLARELESKFGKPRS